MSTFIYIYLPLEAHYEMFYASPAMQWRDNVGLPLDYDFCLGVGEIRQKSLKYVL